jgi:hypothetical protein
MSAIDIQVMELDGVLKLTLNLMQEVENQKEMTGQMKKAFVQSKVIDLLKKENLDKNIVKGIELLLPTIIDTLVLVARSSYNFGKKQCRCCVVL